MKFVFNHKDLQMFGLKLNKHCVISNDLNLRIVVARHNFKWLTISINKFIALIVNIQHSYISHAKRGGGPRVVVSTAAFHPKVRGSFPGLGGLKETTLFLPHPLVKLSIVHGSLRDREVAC